ncbi:hypothetical protein Dthio_PD3603 [Desulfonatronospira thiodismutans ASO3-1]|uniref:Type 4 fimbrial biogenesis protein PilX N-terminal domain-containing protein n=1 Tax=Desulfonatronospira thiodismutans ASO3-1 TaxID=555779 RepID=D6SJU6_9BACT|nr:pilus assembly PilX N-terminal domain-containing protein [Desulfonatronospira thiodismutans]EFI36149.1 hypothetical protein Dthio_PD3603 [Desulfonatronospira thiodismutans ASO3-1]
MSIYKKQAGSALIISIVVLMLLSILGAAALRATNSELGIVRDEIMREAAFYVSESGIEAGKSYLQERLSESSLRGDSSKSFILDSEIDNIEDEEPYLSHKFENDSEYSVWFQWEDDNNNSSFQVISNGNKKDKNVQTTLTLQIDRNESDTPTPDAPFSIHTPNPKMRMQGNPLISGYDHDVPEDFLCGGNCTGLENFDSEYDSMPAIYSDNEFEYLDYQDKHLDSPVETTQIGDSALDETGIANDYWIDYANRLLPNYDRLIEHDTDVPGNDVWGDRENPQITIVDNKKLGGTIDGAGVLILKNGADITGNFHFEGIVVYMVEEGDTIDMFSAGTPNIFGSVVVAGEELSDDIYFEDEIGYLGNANVSFSSEAILNSAHNAIPPYINIVSWENK